MTSIASAKLTGQTDAEGRSESRIGLKSYAFVLAQLVLLLLLLRQYQIESAAFLRLAGLTVAGFAVHALLPLSYRLPFFLLLSMTGIGLVLGIENGVWLASIGLVLIGICHLPFSFRVRGALLAAAAAVLALQRAQWLPFPWSEAIWPILGGMFMFRLIVYFYDLRHEKSNGSATQSMSYFFMLPNACFPLFPVVDYKTFRRNYYDDEAYRIYQVGIDWIVRGVIHLLLYRYIYMYLTLAPHEVTQPSHLVQFLVTNFLLYLRVSGLFHLIIGMLYLFGFRLPETHNRYLLASSFTDFWRRINIYWKDFMQKVFYYPAVLRLRKLGATRAIVVATLYVFFMTWLLHAYQWFWLRGSMLLVWQDVLFWAILGLLVVASSLYEMKHGRARSLGASAGGWRSIGVLVAKRYAMFWVICVLWSFWTTDTLSDWFSVWGALRGRYTIDALLLPAIVLVVIALGSIPDGEIRNVRVSAQSRRSWLRARVTTLALMVGLVGVSIEDVHKNFGTEIATVTHTLRSGKLSRLDTAKLERGYYENLLSVDRFNSQLWEVYSKKPANWLDIDNANLKRFVGGFARVELIPSFVATTKYGTISINRFGMRDKDYEAKPAPGTYRAALLGASSVMGWGVGDGMTFEALVEDRLNRERPAPAVAKYELLNLAVPGYAPPQQLPAFEKALGFDPDAVYYVATGREISRAAYFLAQVTSKRIDIPYDELRRIVEQAGITPQMEENEALKRLAPHRNEVLAVVYRSIAAQCRARGIVPVWIFLPQVREGSWQEETPETEKIAREAGFVIVNLEDVYRSQDITSIRLAEWDDHPNERGHRLVAERLYAKLVEGSEAIFQAKRPAPSKG